jgi:hypothetical protein
MFSGDEKMAGLSFGLLHPGLDYAFMLFVNQG